MLRMQSAFLPLCSAGLCSASVGAGSGRRPHQRPRAGARLRLCRRPGKQQANLTEDTTLKRAESSRVGMLHTAILPSPLSKCMWQLEVCHTLRGPHA